MSFMVYQTLYVIYKPNHVYTYIAYRFGFNGFYGISNIVGYL